MKNYLAIIKFSEDPFVNEQKTLELENREAHTVYKLFPDTSDEHFCDFLRFFSYLLDDCDLVLINETDLEVFSNYIDDDLNED